MQQPTERNRRKAFTLVELALVMVICALLAALIYPAVRSSWAAFSHRSGADDFVRLLRQTRLYAVQTQQPCEMRFVATSAGEYKPEVYIFDQLGGEKKISAAWTQTLADVPIKTAMTQNGTLVTPWAIKFYPSGVKVSVLLTVDTKEGAEKTITISAPSGMISVGVSNGLAGGTSSGDMEQIKLFWQEQCLKTITQ